MTGHLSPDNASRNPVRNERGNTTRVLLLVLLLVVAAGAYLYFFTDLIRPVKEASKPPVVQTAQVKKPIPPRPGQPGALGEPAKTAETKPSPGAPPASAPPQKKETEPKGAPVTPPPAKQEPAKVAKAEAPQKPAVAPPTPAPAKPTAPAKPASAASSVPPKPAPAPAKPAVAPVKPAPAQAKPAAAPAKPAAPVRVAAAPAKSAPKEAKQPVKKKGGAYALQVGDFVPGKTLSAVQAKLKKSGIGPVRMTSITAPEPMKRLEVALFTDQNVAESELQKLKGVSADAFLVADNGTYSLYAGSYFSDERLHYVQRQLSAKGIKSVVRKIQLPIKVMRVSAGSYATPGEARDDEQRLKKMGLAAKVVKTAKK